MIELPDFDGTAPASAGLASDLVPTTPPTGWASDHSRRHAETMAAGPPGGAPNGPPTIAAPGNPGSVIARGGGLVARECELGPRYRQGV